MDEVRFVLNIDEDTQSLIINSLLLMREVIRKDGLDTGWIADVITDICNAPAQAERSARDAHER